MSVIGTVIGVLDSSDVTMASLCQTSNYRLTEEKQLTRDERRCVPLGNHQLDPGFYLGMVVRRTRDDSIDFAIDRRIESTRVKSVE